ncbi:hypothetical protein [Sphingomonas oryzagri]
MLSLIAALLAATAPALSSAPEIVVTAKHDKCFVEYGQHPVSDADLRQLSQSWALGTPVRVIEPRGANLKCEFEIMKSLAAHGQHVAQFVAPSEDLSPEDTRAEEDERVAERRKQAAAATPPMPLMPAGQPAAAPSPSGRSGKRHRAAPSASRSIAQAPSGIVTLACTMADPEKPYQLDVIVNEERGTATPSRPDTGGGSEMKALFMPDAVRFGPFTINRSTLQIWRQNAGNTAAAASQPAIVRGQCALADLRRVF